MARMAIRILIRRVARRRVSQRPADHGAAGRIPACERSLENNVYNSFAGMHSWSEHFGDTAMRLFTTGRMALFYSAQFLIRPWRVVGTMSRIARGRPDTMLERMLEGIVVRMRGVRKSGRSTVPRNVEPTQRDDGEKIKENSDQLVSDAA